MRGVLRLLWMTSTLIIVALISALTAMRFAIHGREVTVPEMRGKAPAEARRLAEARGLDAGVEREYYSPTVPEGKVLSQMPAAGTVVRRGWQVRLAGANGHALRIRHGGLRERTRAGGSRSSPGN